MFLPLSDYCFIFYMVVMLLTFRSGAACFHPDKSLHTIATMSKDDQAGVYPVNTTISYRCDTGYELLNNESRQCLENGSWSGSEPYCGLNVFTQNVVLRIEDNYSTLEGLDLKHFYQQCFRSIDNQRSTTWTIQLNDNYKIDFLKLAFEHDYVYREDPVDLPKVRFFSSKDINSLNPPYSDMTFVFNQNISETGTIKSYAIFQYAVGSPSPSDFVSFEIQWSQTYFQLCNLSLYTNSVALENPCDLNNDTSKHVIYDHKCFILFRNPLTWKESDTFCHKNQKHESTLASFTEHDEIAELIQREINRTHFAPLHYRIKDGRIHFYPKPETHNLLIDWRRTLGAICTFNISTCGTPDQRNGTSMDVYAETSATYSCPNDFELVGSAVRNCINGRWSSQAPTCTRESVTIAYVSNETSVSVPNVTSIFVLNVTLSASNNCQNQENSASCVEKEKTLDYIIKTTIIVVAVVVIVQWLVTGSIFIYLKYKMYR